MMMMGGGRCQGVAARAAVHLDFHHQAVEGLGPVHREELGDVVAIGAGGTPLRIGRVAGHPRGILELGI